MITWVYSEEGGYWPCANSQEMEMYKKAGFKPCGDPAVHDKNAKSAHVKTDVKTDVKATVPDVKATSAIPTFVPDAGMPPTNSDMSREELLAIAETRNITVDSRWGTTKLREVLGL